jgi:hypothetical protein
MPYNLNARAMFSLVHHFLVVIAPEQKKKNFWAELEQALWRVDTNAFRRLLHVWCLVNITPGIATTMFTRLRINFDRCSAR